MLSDSRHGGIAIVVALIAAAVSLFLLSGLGAEILWFVELGYTDVFLKRALTQGGLGVLAVGTSAAFLLLNLNLADRLAHRNADPLPTYPRRSVAPPKERWVGAMGLRRLIPALLGLALLVAVLLYHYARICLIFFRPNWRLPFVSGVEGIPGVPEDYLPEVDVGVDVGPPIPQVFELDVVWDVLIGVATSILLLFFLTVVVLVLLFALRWGLRAIAASLSLFFGLILSDNWSRVLQFIAPTNFGLNDPLFGNDISVYIFRLPIWELLDFWLGGLLWFSLFAVTLVYLRSPESIARGKFPGFSVQMRHHLYAIGGLLLLVESLRHGLARYELLYSSRGVTFGASYTDVTVQLPVETVLSLAAASVGVGLVAKAISWRIRRRILGGSPTWILGIYLTLVAIGAFLPPMVQRLEVQPNELDLERPFIERSIAFTRAAFALDRIESRGFDPQGDLSLEDIRENQRTIENIRIWDARPLQQTNRQLQQIRPYYQFPDADIDRYTIRLEADDPDNDTLEESRKQQVFIAARELDYENVPERVQTWISKHLIYTHGYGFTLAPVNEVGEGGLPNYFVRDIGGGGDEAGTLRTSNPLIRDSIPIGKPRIYYGELTASHVLVPSARPELDYPDAEGIAYNRYDGEGGINIGSSLWRRWLLASYLGDWRMLFTRNLIPETRVLFRREVRDRVQHIAPFLRFDGDPYLVSARTGDEDSQNYLHWIIDAYTISDRYPYSEPGENAFNYIRNSVKVVVDAYSGKVRFYVVDPEDPIIQTWDKIFPGLLVPIAEMPPTLYSHIRYPTDIFSIQSERLLTYHMTDPEIFFNQEDRWQIPQEIYGGETQVVEPYYLILKLPTAEEEEFILLHPFTPAERNNLIGWLAGRSDGDAYGKLFLYEFPKQELVYGPEQIEALIQQDPVISQQISLWNTQGSRVTQGNLLVIPIEQSLLYVEPLYLEAERNSLPTLARVIVVYRNRIVMAQTVQSAIEAIFLPEAAEESPAIIRPVDELFPSVTPPDSEEE